MMTYQSTRRTVCRNSIAALLFLIAGNQAYSQEVALMVISNSKGAPAEMKMSELKSVFQYEKQRWKDNSKVSLYLMKTTTVPGKSTCSKIYDKSGMGVLDFFTRLQFAGKSDYPAFCNTADELESKIADNPGAIGITDKPPSNPNIKVVLIDGKKSF